jgi:hypothetical protein
MSSTSGVQNFLVNVFRPVYRYEIPPGGSTSLFTPKLELSNIDNYSGNTVTVFTASVGDGSNNCYVGKTAGNDYTTIKACSNVTAVGVGAGSNISNVSNSTFLGFGAGAAAAGATSNVAIGTNTNGNGTSNVYVGAGTGSAGSSNVFLGAGVTGTGSGSILIGPGLSDASTNSLFKLGTTYLTGNLSTKWLGLGTLAPFDSNNKLDVSGNLYVFGQQGINRVPTRTLDVNGDFRASDANGTLDFTNGVTSSSNGFASARGTIAVSGGATTIGALKKGLVIVSAVDTASSDNRASRMVFAYTTSDVTDTGSNIAEGNTSITLSSSNIQITDATNATYAWSITYFPLP